MRAELKFLELDNVSLTFGDGMLAVDGLTIFIARGEFAAVVGPSGCGKSTLMNFVTGLAPSRGGM